MNRTVLVGAYFVAILVLTSCNAGTEVEAPANPSLTTAPVMITAPTQEPEPALISTATLSAQQAQSLQELYPGIQPNMSVDQYEWYVSGLNQLSWRARNKEMTTQEIIDFFRDSEPPEGMW